MPTTEQPLPIYATPQLLAPNSLQLKAPHSLKLKAFNSLKLKAPNSPLSPILSPTLSATQQLSKLLPL